MVTSTVTVANVKIYGEKSNCLQFEIHYIRLTIPIEAGSLMDVKNVTVTSELLGEGQVHPRKACRDVGLKASDPANRLGVKVSAPNKNDSSKTVETYAYSPSYQKVNFLVDFLEGKPEDTSVARRWFPKNRTDRPKPLFT
jgi:hypothetical protein